MSIKKVITYILIILFAVGCGNVTEGNESIPQTPQLSPEPSIALDYPYPSPQSNNSNEIDVYPVNPDSGQNDSGQTLEGQLPEAPTDAPQPEDGKGSISGTIFSFTSRMVVQETRFYLTPGWGEEQKYVPPAFIGPEESKGDIIGITDQAGNFGLSNVPPGNYYLVVEAPLSYSLAVESDQNFQPKLVNVVEGQKLVLSVVYVSWP